MSSGIRCAICGKIIPPAMYLGRKDQETILELFDEAERVEGNDFYITCASCRHKWEERYAGSNAYTA